MIHFHRGSSRVPLTIAGLGAVAAALAWAGWSALDSGGSAVAIAAVPTSASATSAPAPAGPVATVQPSSLADVPAAEIAPATVADPAAALPRPDARGPAVVPYGFVNENGQLVAVRATAVATAAPIVPPVTLPAGVRPEDAVVSPTGMIAVTSTAAAVAPAGPTPPRLVTATSSP